MMMGIGGAPEGVLAAAALKCLGGDMQGRLIISENILFGVGAGASFRFHPNMNVLWWLCPGAF